MVRTEATDRELWYLQDMAALDQAAPVMNTWYPVLVTTVPTKIWQGGGNVQTIGEDLEWRLTANGTALGIQAIAAAAGTVHQFNLEYTNVGGPQVVTSFVVAENSSFKAYLFENDNGVTIEIRKTSANGAGNLHAAVMYSLRTE